MKQAGEIWGHFWEKTDRHHGVNKGFIIEPTCWSPLHDCGALGGSVGATRGLSMAGCGFPTSFVLQQFPEWSDGSRMRFGEVMNKVVSLMEISFCSIFILLFGVAQSYWSVK